MEEKEFNSECLASEKNHDIVGNSKSDGPSDGLVRKAVLASEEKSCFGIIIVFNVHVFSCDSSLTCHSL